MEILLGFSGNYFGIFGELFWNFLGILRIFFWDVWLGGSDLGFFWKFLRILREFFGNLKLHTLLTQSCECDMK